MPEAQKDAAIVEIVGAESSEPTEYLSRIYDSETGTYFAPFPSNPSVAKKWRSPLGYSGAGVGVAILDTGMLLQHPWIEKRLAESMDFTGDDAEDRHGHGTWVALLALWASPGIELYNVKILDDTGSGTEKGMIEGIRWAKSKKLRVINIVLVQRERDSVVAFATDSSGCRRCLRSRLASRASSSFSSLCFQINPSFPASMSAGVT